MNKNVVWKMIGRVKKNVQNYKKKIWKKKNNKNNKKRSKPYIIYTYIHTYNFIEPH